MSRKEYLKRKAEKEEKFLKGLTLACPCCNECHSLDEIDKHIESCRMIDDLQKQDNDCGCDGLAVCNKHHNGIPVGSTQSFIDWLKKKASEKKHLASTTDSEINEFYYTGQWLAFKRVIEEYEKRYFE